MYPSLFEDRQIFQNAHFVIFHYVKIPKSLSRGTISNILAFTVFMLEGQMGEALEFCNKVTLLLLPHIDCPLTIPFPFSHSSLISYVSVSLKSEVTYVFVYRANCKGAAAFHLNTASLNKRGVVYLSPAGSKGWLLCVKARHDLASKATLKIPH
jgi:hypothetical protein